MVICTNRIGLMEHENKEKKFQNKQKRKQKQIGKWEINKANLNATESHKQENASVAATERESERKRERASEKIIEPKFSAFVSR